jgi:hypothetical protein
MPAARERLARYPQGPCALRRRQPKKADDLEKHHGIMNITAMLHCNKYYRTTAMRPGGTSLARNDGR